MTPEEIGKRLAEAAAAALPGTVRIAQTERRFLGTPDHALTSIGAEAWASGAWHLPEAEEALWALFDAGWDEGIVATGLLAANMPQVPDQALAIARQWLEQVDDEATADALGWIVIGPGCLALGADLVVFAVESSASPRPTVRRAALMAAMAVLPLPIEGPAAAPLRERAAEPDVQFVERAVSTVVAGVVDQFMHDEDPLVRAALQRVLQTWERLDPTGFKAWREPPVEPESD